LRGGVYFIADFFAFFVVSFLCFILDLIFFPVISSFQQNQWVEIEENGEGFVASAKRKFLSLTQGLAYDTLKINDLF